MNKYDDQLERLIHQSIQEDFNNITDLQNSKEKTWNDISKQLPRSHKSLSLRKPVILIAGLLALFIMGTSLMDVPSTKALSWFKEFFVFKKDTTLYMGSGSSPIDDSGNRPPSSEEFVVLEGVSTTHTVTTAKAVELASFKVLVPTYLPEGYTEKEAIVDCYNDTCDDINLIYENAEGKELRIEQQHFQGAYGAGRSIGNVINNQEVDVKGIKATLITTSHENLKFVMWSNNNTEYSIDAYLSEDDILKVAESLE